MATERTAAQTYAAHQRAIRAKLDLIREQITDHGMAFEKQGRTCWGHVGDMDRINELLDRIVDIEY